MPIVAINTPYHRRVSASVLKGGRSRLTHKLMVKVSIAAQPRKRKRPVSFLKIDFFGVMSTIRASDQNTVVINKYVG
jgi:hypothetical protein